MVGLTLKLIFCRTFALCLGPLAHTSTIQSAFKKMGKDNLNVPETTIHSAKTLGGGGIVQSDDWWKDLW